MLCIFSGCDSGESDSINGSFQVGTNAFGVPVTFFRGVNTSSQKVNVTVAAVNSMLNQRVAYSLSLTPNQSFVLGPNEGWTWQPGEKLVVTYSNGTSKEFTFGNARNPSFGRSKWPCQYCKECSDYVGSGGSSCYNCGHSMSIHR